MSFFDSIILGIVEGLTEFLPISSTGHLILTGELLKIPSTEFLKTFEISIQLGAILAVIFLYWRSFFNIEILKRVIASFIPTAIIGLALYKFIKAYLLGNETVVLWALFLGGIFLIIFEMKHKENTEALEEMSSISYKQALGIGLFQSIAVIPGVSRSAASIVGGLILGLKRTTIVEYSFLLAVPTMLAATGLDLLKSYKEFSGADYGIIGAGFIVSFIVAILVIKLFLKYIRNHTFIPFGVYRIIVALLLYIILI